MKICKNKKYYNFTEKQKRKGFAMNQDRDHPPRSFVRNYNVKFRRKSKKVLFEHIRSTGGYPTLYEDYVYPIIRRCAFYDYW